MGLNFIFGSTDADWFADRGFVVTDYPNNPAWIYGLSFVFILVIFGFLYCVEFCCCKKKANESFDNTVPESTNHCRTACAACCKCTPGNCTPVSCLQQECGRCLRAVDKRVDTVFDHDKCFTPCTEGCEEIMFCDHPDFLRTHGVYHYNKEEKKVEARELLYNDRCSVKIFACMNDFAITEFFVNGGPALFFFVYAIYVFVLAYQGYGESLYFRQAVGTANALHSNWNLGPIDAFVPANLSKPDELDLVRGSPTYGKLLPTQCPDGPGWEKVQFDIEGRVARSTPASSGAGRSGVKGRKRKTTVDIWRNTGFCIHRANASFSARARESALIATPGTTAAEFYANGGIVPLTGISTTSITETPPPPVGELCPQDEVYLIRSCKTADSIDFATTNLVDALAAAEDSVIVEDEAGESGGVVASKVDNTLHTSGIHPIVNIRLYSRFIDPATGFVHGNETRPCGGVRIGSLTQNGFGWKQNLKDQQRCRPDTHVVMLDTVPGSTLVEWDKQDLEHDTFGARVDCAGGSASGGLFSGDMLPNEPYVCAVDGDGFNFLVQHDKGPIDKKLQLQWFFGFESERDWSSECAITREQLQLAVSQLQFMERAESVAYVIANIFFVVIMISSFYLWWNNVGDKTFEEEKKDKLNAFNNAGARQDKFEKVLRAAELEAFFYGLLAIPSLVLLIYSLILIFASEIVYEERKLGMFNPMNNNTAAICTSDPGLETAIQDIMTKVEVKQIDGPNSVLFIASFIASVLSIMKLRDFYGICMSDGEEAWKKAADKTEQAVDVPYGIWCYTEKCLKPGKYPYEIKKSRSHSVGKAEDNKWTFCGGKDSRICGVKEIDVVCGCFCCCCIAENLAKRRKKNRDERKKIAAATEAKVAKKEGQIQSGISISTQPSMVLFPNTTTDSFGFSSGRGGVAGN